jgi:hypothetical protein
VLGRRCAAAIAAQFDLRDVLSPMGVRAMDAIVFSIAHNAWPARSIDINDVAGWSIAYVEACDVWLRAEHKRLKPKYRRAFRRVAKAHGWTWSPNRRGSWTFMENDSTQRRLVLAAEFLPDFFERIGFRWSMRRPDMQNIPLRRWKPHEPIEIPDWLKNVDYAKLESRLARGIAYHKAFEKKLRRAEKRAVRRTRRLAKTIPISTHTWGMAIDVDASKKGTPK